MKNCVLLLLFLGNLADGQPMELRVWNATSGHKTEARALSATSTTVTLELKSGKTVELALEKLIPADRDTIATHFKIEPPKAGKTQPSASPNIAASDSAYPLGQISGPVESAPGSHFHIYVPKSLKKGSPAPVMHYNDSSSVDPSKMKRMLPVCERLGWILVGSVESCNQSHGDANYQHAVNNIKYLKKSPLVNPDRIYFTGGSGGGATSWANCGKLKAAGTLPMIGYIPQGASPSGGHHFVIGGARDYNRYLSAHSAAKFGKDGLYRAYPGSHTSPAEDWVFEEGFAWLTAKYLEKNKTESSLAPARLDFEAAMINWIGELKSKQPHFAYHLGKMMQEVYKISGENAKTLSTIVTELAAVPTNVKFSEGLAALHDLGVKTMSGEGEQGGSAYNTTFPDHTRKAEKLAEVYVGIPFVAATLGELSKPTQSK